MDTRFEPCMLGIVIFNAVFVGLRIDNLTVRDGCHPGGVLLAFNIVYTLESCAKIYIYGVRYLFTTYEAASVVVTGFAWIELLLCVLTSNCQKSDHSHVMEWIHSSMSFDLVQLAQMIRMVRLGNISKSFKVVLKSLTNSVRGALSVLITAFLVFVLIGCFCRMTIGRWAPIHYDEDIMYIVHRFDNLPATFFTLFELMTIDGWASYVRPLMGTPMWYCIPVLMGFVVVANFFVLNFLTAVVVENMLSANFENERNETIRAHEKRTNMLCHRLRTLNQEKPLLDSEDLETWVSDDHILMQVMDKLRWNKVHVLSLFTMADRTHEGKVEMSDFDDFVKESHRDLCTSNYIKFHQMLSYRIDDIDGLCEEMVNCLQALAKKRRYTWPMQW
eukprot:TRINITY_DN33185_c0_g1_i1.p1 TRINITY_DN33185_c0_g1~~TRINITY_DN33185_c0_g1_i1.p1  ORF type:complete len:388 (-),score=54.34 TRINITY_DN33185_c0_g1_i1:107-1270(-)